MELKASFREIPVYLIVNPKKPTMSQSISKFNRKLCCRKMKTIPRNVFRISSDVRNYGNEYALAKKSIKTKTASQRTEIKH